MALGGASSSAMSSAICIPANPCSFPSTGNSPVSDVGTPRKPARSDHTAAFCTRAGGASKLSLRKGIGEIVGKQQRHPDTIHFRGKNYPVEDSICVGKRDYWILKRLSGRGRERFLALDPSAGPGGDLRMLHILAKTAATAQHLHSLSKLSQINATLPFLDNYQLQPDRIIAVTRWVWGITLSEYLADCRSGKRPWPSPFIAFSLFRQFVHGLCQMHDRLRIVHGDIHPDNIVVGSDSLKLVLIDFGSAWTEERATTRVVGDGNRDGYAAPEMEDPTITPNESSDQFSATVILYVLLMGELPFEGYGGKAGWADYRNEFRNDSPSVRTVVEKRGDFPRDLIAPLERIVATGLSLDRNQRFRTGAAWRDALDDLNGDLRRGTRLSGWGGWFADVVAKIGKWVSGWRGK